MNTRRIRGYTLTEVLIALVIIGLLCWVIAPNAANSKNAAEIAVMEARAAELNHAQVEYVAASGVNNAVANWASQANDAARYLLLTPYLQYPPAALSTFELQGFTITFASDPRNPVTLLQGTNTISYQ